MFRKRTTKERIWEILPGLQFWLVFAGAILLSHYQPIWAALFIICFDLYWVLKAINVAVHLVAGYRKFKALVKIDWLDYTSRLNNFEKFLVFLQNKFELAKHRVEKKYYGEEIKRIKKRLQTGRAGADYLQYFQLVLIPFADENFEVLDSTLSAIADSNYPKEKMLLVLASEERMGDSARQIAEKIKKNTNRASINFLSPATPTVWPEK